MSILSEIKSLDTLDVVVAVVVFSASVTPGFLIIQLFKPALVVDLDIVKLIVFSVALTSPQLALSLVALAMLDTITGGNRFESAGNRDISTWISLSAFTVLYASLLIAYVVRLSFPEFLVVVVTVNVVCTFVIWLILRRKTKA